MVISDITISDIAALSPRFFSQSTHAIARALLNCVLYTHNDLGAVGGRIVETEVYEAHDPSSHSYKGMTPRNSAMFNQAGTVYVYISYGIHHCMNIVTEPAHIGSAVLIRALEPLFGLEHMRERRGLPSLQAPYLKRLSSGPGCLTQALGITLAHNNIPLQLSEASSLENTAKKSPASLMLGDMPQRTHNSHTIMVGERIGISESTDWQCRYFLKDNAFVSAHRRGVPYQK